MNIEETNSLEKNIKGVLISNPLQWIIIDYSALLKYEVFFILCNIKNGQVNIDENQLPLNSIQHFEWTNEANSLYLTGKMVINDIKNIMPKYFNTFTAVNVIIKKYSLEEEEPGGSDDSSENESENNPRKFKETFLNEFDHIFVFDRISIDKQKTRQSSSNHVLVYNISLKSFHTINLIAHGNFSNWDSDEVTFGNYSQKDIEENVENTLTNTLKKSANFAKNFSEKFASKIKSKKLVEKLQDLTSNLNSAISKLNLTGNIGNGNGKPVKIYSIIENILRNSLNNKNEIFKFNNFNTVFGNQQPILKYCMTSKETVIDAIRYLQQKLFSIKVPHRINLATDNGLTYISFNEFENSFNVINLKDISSFIKPYDHEVSGDIIQVNGGTMIMLALRKIPLSLVQPKQNKFSGMINYFTNFYHVQEYEFYKSEVKKNERTSSDILEFLKYDKNLKESSTSEHNINSYGKNIFSKDIQYTSVYSEDFDNNSYIKLLEDTLFKNVVIIKITGNFFDVPGMFFRLILDDAASGEDEYYSQLNNAIMHITKVTHWLRRTPGLQEGDYYLGEELVLCKI